MRGERRFVSLIAFAAIDLNECENCVVWLRVFKINLKVSRGTPNRGFNYFN